ncbi:CaiB/BaiF CoA transferase family protein [Streptomyces sp. NPDC055078]
MAGPLTGIRVLENANFISGPYAGMLLADQGAEVIKVEMPGSGDPFRRWSGRGEEILPQFAAFNRGKRSVTINLKHEAGRDAYLLLAEQADVVLENFRPGWLDGLGLGYAEVSRRNPRAVYCSLSGMGTVGPYRDRPTYDAIAQAVSGLWSQISERADPRPIGPALSDQITGMTTAYGILGALVERGISGRGQRLETSMLAASLAFMAHPVAEYTMTGEISGPATRPRRSQTYALTGSDGKPFGIHLSSPPKFWQSLTRAIGRPELADDPRFITKNDRIEHYDELHTILAEAVAAKPRDAWLAVLEEYDVPVAPIHDVAEALADPQVRAIGMTETFGAGEQALDLVGFPVRYERTASEAALPPPRVGEHTDPVLAEAGYGPEEIRALRDAGAI